MTVTVEDAAPCRKKLSVEVDPDRVATTRSEIIQEFRKVATVPGFRPGKAPKPIVEKRYADAIDQEIRKRLIPDTYREVLSEKKLRVVGNPQVDSVELNPKGSLSYIALVDTAPEFQLPEYKGIEVEKKAVTVNDEDIQKTLDSIREQQAEFISVEGRNLQMGDFAIVNYSGVVDGKPIIDVVPDAKTLGEQKDFWLLMGSDTFLPGFCDQLKGAQLGEKKQIQIDFPKDFHHASLAGRKATYFVDITAIKEKKLPELTDEIAKRLGTDNIEKLKEKIREGITVERENESNSAVRNKIIESLLSRVSFELPESLLEHETRNIVYDLVRENSQRGVSKDQLEEKKDEILGFASKNAKERLRMSFILGSIAQQEKITVDKEDMEERIQQMSQKYRIAPDKLKAQLAEKDALGEIEEQILVGKTIDFLVANAKVKTVT